MTIRFLPPDYPGGRHLLMCGQLQAGAIFPPVGTPHGALPWVWRLWIGGPPTKEGRAKSELAAKNAVLAALRDFLQRAALTEVEPTCTWTADCPCPAHKLLNEARK